MPDPNIELGYVMDAVAEIRRALDNSVPLIGFSGSPWTLACYMVEGGGSDDYRKVKRACCTAAPTSCTTSSASPPRPSPPRPTPRSKPGPRP